jgi:hypothetical protein
MLIIKSCIFEDMWEIRTDSGHLLGIGKTEKEALDDAAFYDDKIALDDWESPNTKSDLPTWNLI